MRRVVSLFLPTWPTDRLRRRSALPAETPVVTRAHDGRRLVVAAADAAALRLGLHPDMPLAHAQALIPGLHIADADPTGDGRALDDLAAWCLRYAPLTAADPPDNVWIDAAGCAHLFGGEAAMLADLTARLARAGIAARAAIADTPGAAHAMARHGGEAVVPQGSIKEALAPLPVSALRLESGTAAALRTLGLERIGQLAAAPRGPLARRFGVCAAHTARSGAGAGHGADHPRPSASLRPAPAGLRRTVADGGSLRDRHRHADRDGLRGARPGGAWRAAARSGVRAGGCDGAGDTDRLVAPGPRACATSPGCWSSSWRRSIPDWGSRRCGWSSRWPRC